MRRLMSALLCICNLIFVSCELDLAVKQPES